MTLATQIRTRIKKIPEGKSFGYCQRKLSNYCQSLERLQLEYRMKLHQNIKLFQDAVLALKKKKRTNLFFLYITILLCNIFVIYLSNKIKCPNKNDRTGWLVC